MRHDRISRVFHPRPRGRWKRLAGALTVAIACGAAAFLMVSPASAQSVRAPQAQGGAPAQPAASDPAFERRVQAIAEELRCLVCQNQTIADSNAELALDLKRQIRTQLGEGRSAKEIVDFMVQRYGDFVLYRPPLKGTTAALWFGPLAFGAVAVVTVAVLVRRRRRSDDAGALSDADRRQAAELLGGRAPAEPAR